MTPNEKKALVKFKEIKQGNTVAIAGTLRVTINYAGEICKKLWEKGYIETLLPGMFASYKITSLGEEQIKGEARSEIEEIGEYECTDCGTAVREDDTECPRCGMIFEEGWEEETTESIDSSQGKLWEEASSGDVVDEKAGILE